MLVLSRRLDDKILFPSLGITIHVVKLNATQVRLGIDAPPQVQILRHELADDARVAKVEKTVQESTADFPRQALVVDDNRNESWLLASYLRLKRFDVQTATDGADAIDYLSHHQRPSVVLLDMNMPRFDGRWTINAIRNNPRYEGMKVFAVSGLHPAEHGVEVGRNGVDRWFRKPLNPEELVNEINRQLNSQTAAVPECESNE